MAKYTTSLLIWFVFIIACSSSVLISNVVGARHRLFLTGSSARKNNNGVSTTTTITRSIRMMREMLADVSIAMDPLKPENENVIASENPKKETEWFGDIVNLCFKKDCIKDECDHIHKHCKCTTRIPKGVFEDYKYLIKGKPYCLRWTEEDDQSISKDDENDYVPEIDQPLILPFDPCTNKNCVNGQCGNIAEYCRCSSEFMVPPDPQRANEEYCLISSAQGDTYYDSSEDDEDYYPKQPRTDHLSAISDNPSITTGNELPDISNDDDLTRDITWMLENLRDDNFSTTNDNDPTDDLHWTTTESEESSDTNDDNPSTLSENESNVTDQVEEG